MSPAPESRGATAREKARLRRESELARARRRRTALVGAVVVVVLAAVVAIGVTVQSHRNNGGDAVAATPANLTDGGVLAGRADAPVTVTVYEDFQCPVCRNFEQTTGPTLAELLSAGTIKVVSKPVAILDRASSTNYSTRALNAAGCVIDSAPADYPAFAAALFAKQPEEGGAGLSDDTLVDLAGQAGASGVQDCVTSQRFKAWALRATDQASKDGLTGTPYVLVDGKAVTDTTAAGLRAAVTAARP